MIRRRSREGRPSRYRKGPKRPRRRLRRASPARREPTAEPRRPDRRRRHPAAGHRASFARSIKTIKTKPFPRARPRASRPPRTPPWRPSRRFRRPFARPPRRRSTRADSASARRASASSATYPPSRVRRAWSSSERNVTPVVPAPPEALLPPLRVGTPARSSADVDESYVPRRARDFNAPPDFNALESVGVASSAVRPLVASSPSSLIRGVSAGVFLREREDPGVDEADPPPERTNAATSRMASSIWWLRLVASAATLSPSLAATRASSAL